MRVAAPVCGGANQRKSAKRRPARCFTLRQGLCGYECVATFDEAAPERVRGKCRLNQDLAGALLAAGTAGDLDDQLRHALVAAKVRAEQALIGVDHADKRQLRKVMALGQHLRADQYVRLAVRRQCECRVDSAFALRAVAVDSRHAAIREATLQYVLESFCPLTKRFYGRPAQGAALIECPLSSAVVAS